MKRDGQVFSLLIFKTLPFQVVIIRVHQFERLGSFFGRRKVIDLEPKILCWVLKGEGSGVQVGLNARVGEVIRSYSNIGSFFERRVRLGCNKGGNTKWRYYFEEFEMRIY